MWVMACTFTAVTTNSAKPCPSDSSQNAGVRSASRAVKSRVEPFACIACSLLGVSGSGSPSTHSPYSSGRPRITKDSGRPASRMITPEPKAVARQP